MPTKEIKELVEGLKITNEKVYYDIEDVSNTNNNKIVKLVKCKLVNLRENPDYIEDSVTGKNELFVIVHKVTDIIVGSYETIGEANFRFNLIITPSIHTAGRII